MKEIISLEEACALNGTDPNDPRLTTGTQFSQDFERLAEITRALNKDDQGNDWIIDWNDRTQDKWENIFLMDEPGFRFLGSYFGVAGAGTTGGSRLCFRDRKTARYAAINFLTYYKPVWEARSF